MMKLVSKNLIFISFILVLFLPEGLAVNFHIQSASIGGLLSWFLLFLFLFKKNNRSLKLSKFFLSLFLTIVIFIILSLITGLFINRNFDFFRYFSSILLIIFQFSSAYLLVKRLGEESNDVIDKILKKIALILLLLSYISFIRRMLLDISSKEMFFFTEPSHFAITAAPFFMYYIMSSSKVVSFIFTLGVLFIAMLIENLTIIIPILASIFILNKKVLIVFASIFIILLPIFGPNYYLYLTLRTSWILDSDNHNLSSLVYLQGWEYINSAVKSFNGMGIGFQQLGQIRIKSNSQEILENMGYPFNQNDGSFFFSKFYVEFGLIAILAIFLYLKNALYIYLKLNQLLKTKEKFNIFLSISFLSFFIPLFIRNSNYFNPAIFIFYMSLIGFGLKGGIKKTMNVNK
jgi:hypothetical protein